MGARHDATLCAGSQSARAGEISSRTEDDVLEGAPGRKVHGGHEAHLAQLEDLLESSPAVLSWMRGRLGIRGEFSPFCGRRPCTYLIAHTFVSSAPASQKGLSRRTGVPESHALESLMFGHEHAKIIFVVRFAHKSLT